MSPNIMNRLCKGSSKLVLGVLGTLGNRKKACYWRIIHNMYRSIGLFLFTVESNTFGIVYEMICWIASYFFTTKGEINHLMISRWLIYSFIMETFSRFGSTVFYFDTSNKIKNLRILSCQRYTTDRVPMKMTQNTFKLWRKIIWVKVFNSLRNLCSYDNSWFYNFFREQDYHFLYTITNALNILNNVNFAILIQTLSIEITSLIDNVETLQIRSWLFETSLTLFKVWLLLIIKSTTKYKILLAIFKNN